MGWPLPGAPVLDFERDGRGVVVHAEAFESCRELGIDVGPHIGVWVEDPPVWAFVCLATGDSSRLGRFLDGGLDQSPRGRRRSDAPEVGVKSNRDKGIEADAKAGASFAGFGIELGRESEWVRHDINL